MELFEVLRVRHSIRAFQPKLVEPEKLREILESANRAPSAGNLQAYEIAVVSGHSKLARLARAALEQDFIELAPVALVFCADPERSAFRYGDRGTELYCIQDATIACAYAQLAATALGLASVWVGALDEEEVRRVVQAGAGLKPVAILPIGYPGEQPVATARRGVEEIVRRVG